MFNLKLRRIPISQTEDKEAKRGNRMLLRFSALVIQLDNLECSYTIKQLTEIFIKELQLYFKKGVEFLRHIRAA